MTVVLFALSLTHRSGGMFEVATADPGTAGAIGVTRCLREIFRPAIWFEVIDDCPAIDKPYRKQLVLPPSSKAPSQPKG
jgi:hypothetical protein